MATRRADTTQESRRLLLDAAAGLFAERGYRQTTFADIAERSGVSRGSIPWHFGNKEGLLAAVVEDVLTTVHAAMAPPPSGTPEPAGPESLDRAMERAVRFTRMPTSKLLITLIAEAVEPDSPLHGRYAALHDAMRAQIRAWLAPAALPRGFDLDALAVLFLAVLVGVHQQWRVSPDAVDLESVYATWRTVLATALGITPG
ncbi:TetR/AcrR family transcriptional regulator [Streptomyces specialis]|uniref:TetR/AcrR family transcriptional regulator n=1 Tax=Streptomyces specialis TaxID=498367 RepID=UPI00073EA50A|nr:TetR/AcrR family transcriptional regulator [Streptomyces specialis]